MASYNVRMFSVLCVVICVLSLCEVSLAGRLKRAKQRRLELLGCFEPGRLHLGVLRVPAMIPPRTGLVTSLRGESSLAFGVQFFYNA
jgi:hypothetical protein